MLCRRPVSISTSLALALVASFAASDAAAQMGDWPTFRGADRSGVSPDTGLLTEWPMDQGPPLVWESAGAGRGYSSIAVAGSRLFTLGDGLSTSEDGDEYLACFERQTGQPIWKTKTGPAWNDGRPDWQGSRGTPTVDGDRVYVITPSGRLVCCNVESGEELWSKSLPDDFGGKKGDGWGYSESPLVIDEKLICTPGGEKTTMAALNKLTGDTLWTTVREGDRGAGHASAVVSEVGDARVIVQTTAGGALGVRADDGKLLWSYPIERTTAVCPTPIIRGDLAFISAGYKRGGALLRQVPQGDGGVTIEVVYPLKTELANKHGGIVLIGDSLFGDSDDAGVLFCADFMTGEVKWKGRGPGRGSAAVAAADGRIYVRYASGVLALVEAGGEELTVHGSFEIPGSGERPSWSHPSIAGGMLYLREGDRLLCYDLRSR